MEIRQNMSHSRRAALAEGYMEDTRESRGRKFSGSTAMILGLFITLELMIGGAMIFNYDFHGADIIALLFAFMVVIFWSRSSIDR